MTTRFLGRVGAAPSTPAAGIDLLYQLADGHFYIKNSIGTFDLTTAVGLDHNDLSNIQGGGATERQHMTTAQHTKATQNASGSQDGLLSQTDWSTFNGKSNYADPLTTDGDIVIRDTTTKRLAKGSNDQVLTLVSGLPAWQDSASGLPIKYIQGLQASWVSATTLQIAAGKCRSDDDTFDMVLTSTRNAVITSSGAGGLDTGSESSSTGYYLWLIYDSTTPTYAAMLSLSATSPTMPGNYDKKRLVGYSFNDSSSNFHTFKMFGDGRTRIVQYNEHRQTYLRVLNAGTATSWTDVDCSNLVPVNLGYSIFFQTQGTGLGYIRPNGFTNATTGLAFGYGNEQSLEMGVDDSIVEYEMSSGNMTLDVMGYRMVV